MLDLNLIRTDAKAVAATLLKKGYTVDFTELLKNDAAKRALLSEIEAMKAKRNKVSGEIPKLKKAGQPVDAIFEEMRVLGDRIADGDKKIDELSEAINDFLLRLPNMPDADLLPGEKENNKVVRTGGKKPKFNFPVKNHVDICTAQGLIDYDRGTKLAGSGYWLYRGLGAKLEWALLNYFIENHLKDGYEFILPPHMLGYNCGLGAGQFPKFADEVYWIDNGENDKKKSAFLLPTAETALVNLYAGEIIDGTKLPLKMFGYTPCYRKEAGSYRAEERGMIRGHQFNKVEMVQYAQPENSAQAFEELVNKAAALVEGLGLHYRVSKLAAGDCSASMARTYDIEVWIPSMEIYKEVSSVSNANDYQARRNNTRFRDAAGKIQYVHTLNGSGLATSRVIPAIVEQFQKADGTFEIPEALKKYMF